VEAFRYINDAISRETELKAWRREKKEALIATMNPEWKFLNEEWCGEWPPGVSPGSTWQAPGLT